MAESFEQVLVIPGTFLESVGDGDIWCVAGLQDVSGDAGEGCDICGGVVFSVSTAVFVQADVENPVQVVLDAPMGTDGVQGGLGREVSGCQIEALGWRSGVAVGNDADEGGMARGQGCRGGTQEQGTGFGADG